MKQAKTIERACEHLIRMVRFENACLRLDKSAPLSYDDTDKIRSVTKLYTETWIVPLLKMIRDGNLAELKRSIE